MFHKWCHLGVFLMVSITASAKGCVCLLVPWVKHADQSITYPSNWTSWFCEQTFVEFDRALGDSIFVDVSRTGCQGCQFYVLHNNIRVPVDQLMWDMESLRIALVEPGLYDIYEDGVTMEHTDYIRVLIDHAPIVSLTAKVFLAGPYLSGSGLMSDSLRQQNLIPNYVSGLCTLDPSLLSIAGTDAVVDRVSVELRDPLDPSIVQTKLSALVQRDGDVMLSSDGSSPMTWILPHGYYYVAIKHRNHLGVMTATPVHLDSIPLQLDFTDPAFQTWGNQAQFLQNGVNMLWAGNARWDWNVPQTIKYTGPFNDRDMILLALGGNAVYNTITGYLQQDVNLDGVVKYVGANNDRDVILQTIGGNSPTAVRTEQVP